MRLLRILELFYYKRRKPQIHKETVMQIDIEARSFTLTKALKSYIEKKLKSTLSSYGKHPLFKRAVIRLSNVNGPRGGEDKLCHIQLMLAGAPDIIIKNTEQDIYAAIDIASRRAGNAVVRRLERQRRRIRNHAQLLGPEALV
jgi:putative sigma-54 modulation protein